MSTRRARTIALLASAVSACSVVAACSEDSSSNAADDGGTNQTDGGAGSDATSSGDGASSNDGSASNDGGASDASKNDAVASGDGGLPAGWLFTQGNKIKKSDGNGGGSVWMGRGVNVDDIFLCGYDNTLWMTNPDQTLKTMLAGLVADWKPTFVRLSLSMASYPTTVSWLANAAQYKTPMTGVIDALGANPGVYVLVTVRSDASMIGQDQVDGDPEATGLPSDSTTTPNATTFPTGSDAMYTALVDTFAQKPYVLFGISNEPGGNKLSNAKIAAAMAHAVGVIRAEEDKLGVPHHLVSVQGNGWTSDISFYAQTPIAHDNVIYEVHGYPPSTASYTYANIPVIIGEYGTLSNAAAFYADVESKQIPNLAWDFESYSNCSPDLLVVNQSATNLQPTAWGTTVKNYLGSH